MLKDDGIVVFTMMSTKNYYYNTSEKVKNNGLTKVTLEGRLNETTYINFVENEEDMINKFKLFKPLKVGYYDFLTSEGSSFHYYFIGMK